MTLAIAEDRLEDSNFEDIIKKFKRKKEEGRVKALLSQAVKDKDEKAVREYQKRLIELKKFS